MRVALCEPAAAEATRRALDQEGLLDVSARAFRTDEGLIALPLRRAQDTDGDQTAEIICWSGGTLRTAELEPPAGRNERGPSAALRSACGRALQSCSSDVQAVLLAPTALPRRWEKLGDIVLFAPSGMFDTASLAGRACASLPGETQNALWAALASELGARRVGVQARIDDTLQRKSRARLLWPVADADGWTVHRENGLIYGLDVTRSMFSSGNGTEKARVGRLPCAHETVVDLYAGIGYFTLSYLVHAHASYLHACEWDEDALVALRHNLKANGVDGRCTVYPGDNALSLPHFRGIAHRVNLGLIPSSEAGWPVAVAALRPEGGMLHVHANVGASDADEASFCATLLDSLRTLSAELGRGWTLSVEHLERVKMYAPKIRHVVVDVRCELDRGTQQ